MMKVVVCLGAIALVGVVLLGCGGGQKEAQAELEKAAEAMAKEQAAAQPPQQQPAAAPATPEAAPMETVQEQPVQPAAEVRQALVEYKAGKMEDAVIRLQKLRSQSALTAQQRMALQDSVAAVMQEIYGMAEKGDQRAIRAVREYEEWQNRKR